MEGIFILAAIVVVIVLMIIKNHEKETEDGFEVFVIKRGRHNSIKASSFWPFNFKFGMAPKTLKFAVVFGDGCDYEDNNSGDINKLYGISYGFDNHYRSVRIGWLYNSNLKVIELYTYAYVKGNRVIRHLMNVQLYESIYITLWKVKNEMVVRISVSDTEKTERKIDFVSGIDHESIRFRQYPYYGGNNPAPNDIKIMIKEM